MDWFKIRKGLIKTAYHHPAYLTSMLGTHEICQARIKIAGRNMNNLQYADNTILMVENAGKLKNLLMKVKKESEKAGLNLNIQKLRSWHPVAGSITSWQIDGEKFEIQTLFYSALVSLWMVTAAMKLKKCLLLRRKAMKTLDIVLKSKDITLSTKLLLVKAMVFPVVMY